MRGGWEKKREDKRGGEASRGMASNEDSNQNINQ